MNEINNVLPSHLTDIPERKERAKNSLGKDDFMKLLMTQLQNQDPLKPMDHHEFATQLAQFGSLEQLQNIQKSIDGLATGYGDGNKFNALTLMGKHVEASGSEVELMQGQSVGITFSPKENIQPLKAIIYGDGGKIVRELDIDPRAKSTAIEWDGKDTDGKGLPSGKYTFRVQGIDKQGQSTDLSSELSGRVTGVDMNGRTPVVIVKTQSGETRLEISKIKSVQNDDGAAKAQSPGMKVASPTMPKPQVVAPPVDGDGDSQPVQDAEGTEAKLIESGLPAWQSIPGLNAMGDLKP